MPECTACHGKPPTKLTTTEEGTACHPHWLSWVFGTDKPVTRYWASGKMVYFETDGPEPAPKLVQATLL